MASMQIMSKTGKVISELEANHYVVTEPGTVIKMVIDRNVISGTKKKGDDLTILQQGGESIVLEGFFRHSDLDVTKIIIEDADGLYVSAYDLPFAGMSFSSIGSVSDVVGEYAVITTAESVPAWVWPLVGFAAVGGGLLGNGIGRRGKDDKGAKPVEPTEPEKPTDPIDPEKPTDPIDPEKPTDPIEPEKPTDPIDPEKPTDPIDPEKPTDPIDPEKPTDPIDPEKPTDPIDPEKPTNPTEPVVPEETAGQLLIVAAEVTQAAMRTVLVADASLNSAQNLLTLALAEKEQVLKNGEVDRVEAVNQKIKEANAVVVEAQADKVAADIALQVAKAAVVAADEAGADPELSAAIKLLLTDVEERHSNLPSVDVITTELSVAPPQTIAEIVGGFLGSIGIVGTVLLGMVQAKTESILVVLDTVKAIGVDGKDFLKDVVSIGYNLVVENVGAVFSVGLKILSGLPPILLDNILGLIVNPINFVFLKLIPGLIELVFTEVGKGLLILGENIVKAVVTNFPVLKEYGAKFVGHLTELVKGVMEVLFEGFIKGTIEHLIKPLISDPIQFIKDLMYGDISTLMTNMIKLVTEFFSAPMAGISNIGKFIYDLYISLKGNDQVVEKDLLSLVYMMQEEGGLESLDLLKVMGEQPENGQAPDQMPLLEMMLMNGDGEAMTQVMDDLVEMNLLAANGVGEVNLDHVLFEQDVVLVDSVPEPVEAISALALMKAVMIHEDDLNAGYLSIAA